MPYPDSAIVNSRGELLVGLSDGEIINAGKVVGPAGVRGQSGLPGLRGEPGIDGLSCIAAFKAPSQDDGKEGDSWIDCSSAEFAFYRRSGNGWNKIANLRQPAPDRRIGVSGGGAGEGTGGGGGSGGGGAEVHVGPNPPAFPEIGSLWFDTTNEDGRLFIYVSGSWQPVLPQPDLDGYAKQTYVDAQDNALGDRIDDCATKSALQDEADARDTGDKANLGLITANKVDIEEIEANYAKKSDLATATAALPYTIETDKALRLADIEVKNRFTGEAAPMYAGGEIYLTDNLSFFSNVRFTGTNNITTSSDAQGIIVDGANLMPKNLLSLPELT